MKVCSELGLNLRFRCFGQSFDIGLLPSPSNLFLGLSFRSRFLLSRGSDDIVSSLRLRVLSETLEDWTNLACKRAHCCWTNSSLLSLTIVSSFACWASRLAVLVSFRARTNSISVLRRASEASLKSFESFLAFCSALWLCSWSRSQS